MMLQCRVADVHTRNNKAIIQTRLVNKDYCSIWISFNQVCGAAKCSTGAAKNLLTIYCTRSNSRLQTSLNEHIKYVARYKVTIEMLKPVVTSHNNMTK